MEPRRPKHKQQPPLAVSIEELEQALLQPETYDGVEIEAAAAIDVVQTHASLVFRLPTRVYKVKKPVNYGYLDFSTLYKRFQACYAEVQLNQRLAPDVYVGVVPISMQRATRKITVRGADFWTPEKSSTLDYWLNDTYGEIIEWAVHMHRLSDQDTLLHKLEHGELTPSMLRAVADRLVAFHRDARRGPTIDAFGEAEVVRRNIDQNFAQTASHVQDTVSVRLFERVRALTYERLDELEPVMCTRKQHGHTCDSHGDLRLEHIYVQPPQANAPKTAQHQFVILDCIEFNEHFRYGDPLSDAAFLMMDVWRMGRPDLARCFQQQYLQTSLQDTPDTIKLFAFYAAYRAVVRAKISGFRARDEKLSTDRRDRARQDARCYWLVALTLLSRPRDRPCLILVGGLPATGKSNVAKMLANDESTMHWIRADAIRKELLHHMPSQQTIAAVSVAEAVNNDSNDLDLDLDGNDSSMVLATRHGSYEEGMYAPAMTQRTYDEMLIRSVGHLREGSRVVVDATFRNPEHRGQFIDAARSEGALFALIVCECDREIAKGRMLARKNDLSDATWEVFEHMERDWSLDDVHDMAEVAIINTEKEKELTARRTLGFLRKLELVENA